MSENEVLSILDKYLRRSLDPAPVPSVDEWSNLERQLGIVFPENFKLFINSMSVYEYPGDILNVNACGSNGNDSILLAYELETASGPWPIDLIPFYGVGNGDYICFNRVENEMSKVYYLHHDDYSIDVEYESFDDWLLDIPSHVN